jgi:hypothetical protein
MGLTFSNSNGSSGRFRAYTTFLSSDPDVNAFLSATGITDETTVIAMDTLVGDLKGYGLWSKMIAIYPFVGGTATTHKYNLKNPVDSDAAFRLSFVGGWTHSSTGALPNGVNAYANTFLSPSQTNYLDFAYGDYLRTNSDGVFAEMGINLIPNGAQFYPRLSNNINMAYASTSVLVANTDSRRSFFFSQQSGALTNYKDGLPVDTRAYTPNNISTEVVSYFLSARNLNPGAGQYSNRQKAFTFFSNGIDSTEASNLHAAIVAFQTTLGRQV